MQDNKIKRMTMDEVEAAIKAQEEAGKVSSVKKARKPSPKQEGKRRRVVSQKDGSGEGAHPEKAARAATRLSERQATAKSSRQPCGEHGAGSNLIPDHLAVIDEGESNELPFEGAIPQRRRPSRMSQHWEGLSDHVGQATRVVQREFHVMNSPVESELDQLQRDVDYAQSNHIPVTIKSWISKECRSMITAAFRVHGVIEEDDENGWIDTPPLPLIERLRLIFVGGGSGYGNDLNEVLRRFRQLEVPLLGESRERDTIFINRVNTLVENYVSLEVRESPEMSTMLLFRETLTKECGKNLWGRELFARVNQQAKEFAWRPWFRNWLMIHLSTLSMVEQIQPFYERRSQGTSGELGEGLRNAKRTGEVAAFAKSKSRFRVFLQVVEAKSPGFVPRKRFKNKSSVAQDAEDHTTQRRAVGLAQKGNSIPIGILRKFPGRRVPWGKSGW